MTDSIRSYPENVQEAVVRRRLRTDTGGLGWLAALDAERIIDLERKAKQKQHEQEHA